ncbi:MAG TPA: hypothetical protein VF700_04010, partial [Segetibacter sp.]
VKLFPLFSHDLLLSSASLDNFSISCIYNFPSFRENSNETVKNKKISNYLLLLNTFWPEASPTAIITFHRSC